VSEWARLKNLLKVRLLVPCASEVDRVRLENIPNQTVLARSVGQHQL